MTGMLSTGGCDDRRAKHSREEPPHVWGQGQKPGGPHARRAAAKRSYPTSEVRGSGREYQTAMAQEQQRGATPRPRSGGWPRGDTRYLRSGVVTRGVTTRPTSGAEGRRSNSRLGPGAVAGRTNPRSKEPWLRGRRGPRGAIPLWRSGGVAVRRDPSSKVRSNGCALLEQAWRDNPCQR